ncbi:hypothetical protein Scep_008502 [Stephania cephalantha]|uniref:Uncharacterized protein n=1 Tax=Stephania cephalantha TaxID=152367 RepID=A0AAP0KEJ0_9MAGN
MGLSLVACLFSKQLYEFGLVGYIVEKINKYAMLKSSFYWCCLFCFFASFIISQ